MIDEKTFNYYRKNAATLVKKYSAIDSSVPIVLQYAERYFYRCSSVLDIGCGTGRDMAFLLSCGYDVYGVEPVAEMIAAAIEKAPVLKTRILQAQLPYKGCYFGFKFYCVLCSAVLMHIPDEYISDCVSTIKDNMIEGGRLLLSVPVERDDLDENYRDSYERLHIMRSPLFYLEIFLKEGFSLLDAIITEDGLKRKGIKWCILIFELRSLEI
ncbi:MAG TPA: class I SAM-dependent methyltransferase [Spirochaetota bacterium]|nr:class I SAM-dependent methyltransferase [Spirochaetota bacterium]HON17257.1 class I SAM-dependent methyltransferase [Spirochaetota bacterium]